MTITEALQRAMLYIGNVLVGVSGREFEGQVTFVGTVDGTIEFQPKDRVPSKLVIRTDSIDYVTKV